MFGSNPGQSKSGSASGSQAGSDSGVSGEGPVKSPSRAILGQKPLIKIFSAVHETKVMGELKSKENELKKKTEEVAALLKDNKSEAAPDIQRLQEELDALRKAIDAIKDGICEGYALMGGISFLSGGLAALKNRLHLMAQKQETLVPKILKSRPKKANGTDSKASSETKSSNEAPADEKIRYRDISAYLTGIGIFQVPEVFNIPLNTPANPASLAPDYEAKAQLAVSQKVEEEGGLTAAAAWLGRYAALDFACYMRVLNEEAIKQNQNFFLLLGGCNTDSPNHAVALCFQAATSKEAAAWHFIDANFFPHIVSAPACEDSEQFRKLHHLVFPAVNMTNIPLLRILNLLFTTEKNRAYVREFMDVLERDISFQMLHDPFSSYEPDELVDGLFVAAKENDLSFIKHIINAPLVTPNKKKNLLNEMKEGRSAIEWAYRNNFLEAFYWLARGGAHVDFFLNGLFSKEKASFLEIIVAFKTNLNLKDRFGQRGLYIAVYNARENLDALQTLVRCGANVNAPKDARAQGDRNTGWTPVHAAASGFADALDVLLANGGNANVPDAAGWTPLFLAASRAKNGSEDCLCVLAKYGLVDENAKTVINGKERTLQSFFEDNPGAKQKHATLKDFLVDAKKSNTSDAKSDGATKVFADQEKYCLKLHWAKKMGDTALVEEMQKAQQSQQFFKSAPDAKQDTNAASASPPCQRPVNKSGMGLQ